MNYIISPRQLIVLIGCLFTLTNSCLSQQSLADTVIIRSKLMQRDLRCVVIRPETSDSLPVLYLLHGWSGDYSNWIRKVPELKQWASRHHMMIVCPDGGYDSWYFDSPVRRNSLYESYIGLELPAYIDSAYATRANRNGRAITGLSMGGHGAFFLGLRHPEIFGAAGSMSGGLDLAPIKTRYGIRDVLGDTLSSARFYSAFSVLELVKKRPRRPLALILDCGRDDDFFSMNQAVHQELVKQGLPHDYIERPGKHDWEYWKTSIQFQLVFFDGFFRRAGN